MKKKNTTVSVKLDLRMFEGGAAGDGGAAGAGSSGTGTGDAGTDGQEGNPAGDDPGSEESGVTEEERRLAFEELIKGEYKDLHGEYVQKAINRRYAENQQLHQKISEYNPLVEMLGVRYGIEGGDVQGIIAAIEADDSFYEAAAMKEGLTVDQYKKMIALETQNRHLEEQRKSAQNMLQRDAMWSRWNQEAGQLSQKYEGFDLDTELKDEGFVRMLGAGIDMDTAYKAVHFDEISKGLIVKTQKNTKKQVADTIRAGAGRPTENGVGKSAAGDTKSDVSKMSYKEMDDLIERARNGERITF